MQKVIVGEPIVFGDGTRAPISHAVRAGDFLFVAGQLGVDENFCVSSPEFANQATKALENLGERLVEGGCRLSDVVKVNVFLTSKAHFAEFNRIYSQFFPNQFPARTTVVSDLLIEGALVEIEAIAIARHL